MTQKSFIPAGKTRLTERSVKNMFDLIIIGAGVVGSSIAREMSRYKLKICLLEKEEELAFGVSKSNSGIIHPGTQLSVDSLKGKLCVQGNYLTRKMARELGVDFKEVGELICAFSEEEIFRLHQLRNDAGELKVPGVRLVDQVWLSNNEPNLSPGVLAALFAPTAGIISPYRWVYALAENAVANGVVVHTEAEVEKIEAAKHEFLVSASGKEYKSRYLVNCAGLFADDISRMAGVDDFRIKPVKGEEFILDKKLEKLTRHLIFPLPTKTTKGVLIIKTADGNPMIGPTAQEASDKADLTTSQEGLQKVLAAAKKMVPKISDKDIIAYFAGLRPTAGDDFIIRHEDKVPGFINVAGIQSPGLSAAPAIALMVAGLLKESGLALRKKMFFLSRRKKATHLFNIKFSRTKELIKNNPAYGDIVCRCEMVSAQEIKEAIASGAKTLDGIKFRTRCQSGRCHGSFCTTRVMKILAQERKIPLTGVTKRGKGSEIVKNDRARD
jgi:glycerol-3-phosphate dehydrogenase